ncbi:MAG TPA: cyclase family protein [Gemmatimonadaceae bacterium]|nr:cyclase family protein [Gemmatimonadaceae bacterium]
MIRDISVLVRPGTPEWPGDAPFTCGWTCRLADGDSVNLSHTAGSPHVGTHADAPLHVRDGAPASDALPLAPFIGEALVLDVSDAAPGELPLAEDDPRLAGCTRLILRTGRSIADGSFPGAWPALSPATAAALARRGVQLVGVDAPSVDDRESKTLDVHHALFDSGAYVLENLDLRGVAAGRYELIALPQRLAGLDAAPVRALLRLPG